MSLEGERPVRERGPPLQSSGVSTAGVGGWSCCLTELKNSACAAKCWLALHSNAKKFEFRE